MTRYICRHILYGCRETYSPILSPVCISGLEAQHYVPNRNLWIAPNRIGLTDIDDEVSTIVS